MVVLWKERRRRLLRPLGSAVLAAVAISFVTTAPVGTQDNDPPLTIAGAVPDAANGTLTVAGEHFGARPFVTLDLVPLRIQETSETEIVALVPIMFMPPGEYRLTVSRGSAPAEHATITLALGTAGTTIPSRTRPEGADAVVVDPVVFPDQDDVAATVGDRVITVGEVDREWQRTDPTGFVAAQRQTYETRRQITDTLVANELFAVEAAARGLTVEELLAIEIPPRIVTMPDTAVRSLYQGLGDGARGTTFEQMEPALRAWLTEVTEPELARANYIEELMKISTPVQVALAPPRISIERSPHDAELGGTDAPVEIVVFGDFENAEYTRFAQVFPWVLETFGDRVRIVFKHLPVPERSVAVEAAMAAQCAKAQDQFWAYHDILIDQLGIFDTFRFKQLATEVGLDRDHFDTCLDEGEFGHVIPDALAEASRYAIQGSPSFVVNGRLVPHPPPFLPPSEFFTKVIEEELALQAGRP